MSRRTRRTLLLALPVTLGMIAAALWLLWPRTAITRENAARIQPGMTRADVEALLGGPARDDTTGPVAREDPPEFAPPDAQGRRFRITLIDLRPHLEWHSDEVQVWVHVDAEGRVTDCRAFPMRRTDESLLDRLRRWLGL